MPSILEYFDELAEIEDDEKLMATYKKLYGPALKYSLLFPTWKRANLGFTFAVIGVYSITLGLHFIILSVSVVKLVDDFELACLAFHYWLIFLMIFMAWYFINKDRLRFANVHQIMSQDIGVYVPNRIYSDEIPRKMENDKQKELVRFMFLPGMVVVIAAIALGVPYLQKFNNPPTYNSRGVNMNLPLATYYPIPTDDGILHLIVVSGQLAAALSLAVIVVTLEILLFRVSQAIIFEFKILQYGLQTVLERAKKLYLQTHPEQRGRVSYKNHGYQRCIGICIKDCVKHHHRIQQLLGGYEAVIKWPAAMAFAIGTGVIGLGLFSLMKAKEKGDLEYILLFGMLIVAESLNMYILSVFGENITTESESTRIQIYFVDWHKMNVANRQLLYIFQIGMTNNVIVKAGGLVSLSMDTFSSIMNTSYSFLNLMNADTTKGS